MLDTPQDLPPPPASGADVKRRATIKAGLLAAPAVLTLMARSSLALAAGNGTPGAASAGSTSTVRTNNGNHYGQSKGDDLVLGKPQATPPIPDTPANPSTLTPPPPAAASASKDETPKETPKEDPREALPEAAKATGADTDSGGASK